MKTYKNVCILEEKLSSFISGYIAPLREGSGFEKFSDECILYALLEYSQFVRPFTEEERILYLYSKCGEYSNFREDIEVKFDDNGNFYIFNEMSIDNVF
jgi:hypothetical protein